MEFSFFITVRVALYIFPYEQNEVSRQHKYSRDEFAGFLSEVIQGLGSMGFYTIIHRVLANIDVHFQEFLLR